MISKNLNYLRKKNKISQQVLANAMELPRTTLGDYERGKTEPNLAMLIKLADYFEVKVDDDLVYSKLATGRHAEYAEVAQPIRRVLGT